MNVDRLSDVLLWSALVNYSLLMLWFALFAGARGWLRRFHGRWFTLDDAQFDAIHYMGMAVHKILIFTLMLAPWLALQLVR